MMLERTLLPADSPSTAGDSVHGRGLPVAMNALGTPSPSLSKPTFARFATSKAFTPETKVPKEKSWKLKDSGSAFPPGARAKAATVNQVPYVR